MRGLSDAAIKEFWPDANPEDIREQWDNLHYKIKKDREARYHRKNVINWTDCTVLTKLANELTLALANYASKGYEENYVYGDMEVFVAMINLQKKIEAIKARKDVSN